MFWRMLTAWNCVAFQGSSVLGSEVIPMTRLPPGAPAAPVVSDGVGVPVQPATRASAATPAVSPAVTRGVRPGSSRGGDEGEGTGEATWGLSSGRCRWHKSTEIAVSM